MLSLLHYTLYLSQSSHSTTHSLPLYSTLVIRYLMSADSPYYIYYARDDEEPHFVFIAYSFTCSHLSYLPASNFYHTRRSTSTSPCTITNSKCLGYSLPHPYPCRIPFWTALCGLAGAFTTVTSGIHTSPPLIEQQHQYRTFKSRSQEKDRVSRFRSLPTSITQTLGRLRSPVSV